MSLTHFKEAGFFFRQNVLPLMLIFLVASIPLSWLPKVTSFPIWQQPLPLLLLETLLGALSSAAGLIFIHRRMSPEPLNPWACYAQALHRIGPIILLALISNILIVLGLSLMIIPGLILMFAFLFAEIELVLNGCAPIEALKNSWRRTMGAAQALLPAFTLLLGSLWLMELVKHQLSAIEGIGLQLVIEPLGYATLSAYFLTLIYRIYQCSREKE